MTDKTPTLDSLKEVRLLQKFSESELTMLLQMGSTVFFEEHTNIIIEGELSWGLYILIEGQVGIYKNNKLTGDTYEIGQLRTGSFFGEMSLVDDSPRSATVTATKECKLFFISKDVFGQFLGQSNDLKVKFYESCVKILVSRLRELDENYVVSQYQLWKFAIRGDSK